MEKINELDNEQTALIKYGINNNIPPRLLLIKYKKGDIENSTIKTLKSYIEKLIKKKYSLDKIYNKVNLINTNDEILITDVAFIYYSIVSESGIKDIKQYYESKNIIFNEKEFLDDYNKWLESFKTINDCFLEPIEKLSELQNLLLEQEPLVSSDIDVTEKSVVIIPKVKYQFLSFFDNVIIDEYLVYCHFNYNNIDYFKVHYPVDFNIETIKVKLNIMEFYIKISDVIHRVKYNTEKNHIKFSLPLSAEISDKIINVIKNNLPIEILSIDENLFRGSFNIYDVHLAQAIFYDFLLNNVVKDFMYINESSDIAEEKHHTTINFAPLDIAKPSIKFVIYQKITIANIKVGDHTIPINTPYINVLASKAKTQSSMYQLLNILRRMFTIYKNDKSDIEEFYTSTLPESLKVLKPIREKSVAPKKRKYTVKPELINAYPELFVPNYSKKCRNQEYLEIVPENKVDEVKKQVFEFNGVKYNKQVFQYPPEYFPTDLKRVYLTCNSKDYPFFGIVNNSGQTALTNRSIFPYIPCCFDHDQTRKKGSLSSFYKGPKAEKTKTSTIIKTKKILPEEGIGELPTELETFFNTISSNKFYRLGAINDNNSLIHSVLSAVDPSYLKRSKAEKIKLAETTRKKLINYIPVVKQELYDKSIDEIKQMILDKNIYFDPALFYRLLEEHFNINIYIFYRNKTTDKVELLLPRHKMFYAKYPKELNTVIIYESWGPTSLNLKHPHCEIIAELEDDNYVRKFTKVVGNYLYDTFTKMYKTTTVSVNNKEAEIVQNAYNINITTEIFQYLKIEFSDIKLLTQFIDVFGKQRAVTMSLGTTKFSIIFPPLQPVNLPISEDIIINDHKLITRLFGKPIAYSMSKNSLDGMWYSGNNIKYYFYAPIKALKYKDQQLGPKNPLNIEKPLLNFELVPYMSKLYKDRIIFLQLISWMFYNSDETIESFFEKYVKVGNSEYNYDFSDIQERLPSITNIKEAFYYLKDTNLILKNKIYLYTDKLVQPLKYYLEKFIKANIDPTDIEDFYTIVRDFKGSETTALFIGKNRFTSWLEYNKENLMKLNIIRNDLKDFDTSIIMPYFYQKDNKIYLLQNVIDSTLSRALSISYAWVHELQFLGYNAPEIDLEIEYDTLEINTKYEITEKSNKSDYKVLVVNEEYVGVIIFNIT